MKPFYLSYLIRQWRYDRAARLARKADHLAAIKRGQKRIAEARAAGLLIHADAYTIGISTEAAIYRNGLITHADDSSLHETIKPYIPHRPAKSDCCQNLDCCQASASQLQHTDEPV